MDKLTRLSDAVISGRVEDIAHALIYYEECNPTIADSVSNGIQELRDLARMTSSSLKRPAIHPSLEAKIAEAVNIRRKRLGDALWFSRV